MEFNIKDVITEGEVKEIFNQHYIQITEENVAQVFEQNEEFIRLVNESIRKSIEKIKVDTAKKIVKQVGKKIPFNWELEKNRFIEKQPYKRWVNEYISGNQFLDYCEYSIMGSGYWRMKPFKGDSRLKLGKDYFKLHFKFIDVWEKYIDLKEEIENELIKPLREHFKNCTITYDYSYSNKEALRERRNRC